MYTEKPKVNKLDVIMYVPSSLLVGLQHQNHCWSIS